MLLRFSFIDTIYDTVLNSAVYQSINISTSTTTDYTPHSVYDNIHTLHPFHHGHVSNARILPERLSSLVLL